MSKFNETDNVNQTDAVNLAGGAAYSMSPELELASVMVTAMLEDQYYRTAESTMKRVQSLIGMIPDKKFVAQAAVYARKEFGMRSISHFAAAQLAKSVDAKGTPWIRNFYNQVVVRPDDMAEIISAIGKSPLPNALKRGFADRIVKFDEYQLAKYALKGKSINMVDVVRLVHPKPTVAITKLIKGELDAPETWEVKLTQAGQNSTTENLEANKAEAWKSLLINRKLGYMALVKNLRNIEELLSNDDEAIDLVCGQLTNEKLVASSKLFPFRFYTAIRECTAISGFNRKILAALNTAMELSVSNVPKFDGKTLIILDISGSMTIPLSRKGSINCIDAAALFAAALYKSNDADIIEFGSSAHYKSGLNPSDTLTTIASRFVANGGGTNVQAAFNLVTKKYDRIILLSDMQCWMSDSLGRPSYGYYGGANAAANLAMPNLRKRTGSNPYLYSFDLAANGTLQFPESKVACVAGYSDKVFEIMKLTEQDKQALVNEIKKVVL